MSGNNTTLGGGGLHHVAIRTQDLDASVKFYTEVLGMKTVVAFKPDERSFVQLDAGDGSIVELMQDDKQVEPPRATCTGTMLRTTEIEGDDAVEAAGMEITVPVKAITLETLQRTRQAPCR